MKNIGIESHHSFQTEPSPQEQEFQPAQSYMRKRITQHMERGTEKRIRIMTEADFNELLQLRKQVKHDEKFPNLLNSKGLMEMIKLHQQFGQDGTVFVCDVDSFKEINDAYGHEVGDAALKAVGEVLQTLFRIETDEISYEGVHDTKDVVGRPGGDEFRGYLPEATPEQIHERFQLSEEGKSAIEIPFAFPEALLPNFQGVPPTKITLSIGLAGLAASGDAAKAFRQADIAAYDSKSLGKDRIQIASEDNQGQEKIAA